MRRKLVLDTNIVSAILRRHEGVRARLKEELRENSIVHLCPVVYFEVLRGLRHKDAHGQERRFHALASNLNRDSLEHGDWVMAAHMWAHARSRGRRSDDDADVLIAAYARTRGATVVTANTKDFEVFDLPLENWRAAA
jgi:tRNA(fMet)-specific endonuclease VapC